MKKILFLFFVSILSLTGCSQMPSNTINGNQSNEKSVVEEESTKKSVPAENVDNTDSQYPSRTAYKKQYCINPNIDNHWYDSIDNNIGKKMFKDYYGWEHTGNIDNMWYSYIDDNEGSETFGNYGWKHTVSDEIMVPAQYILIYDKCFDSTKQKGFAANKREDLDLTRSGIWYWKPNGEKIILSYNFQNTPDNFVSGLARFIENNKIGFMDRAFNKVITAQFDWASSFEEENAIFCNGCTFIQDSFGEHGKWSGGKWGKINKNGEIAQWLNEGELNVGFE